MTSTTERAAAGVEKVPAPGEDAGVPSAPDHPPRALTPRTVARLVGVLYLAGMIIGITGNLLVDFVLTTPGTFAPIAANGMLLAIGVMCWLMAAAGDAAHGIVMFSVLRRGSELMAVGYLAVRLLNAVFVSVMALLIAIQIPLSLGDGRTGSASMQALSAMLAHGQQYSYEFAMMALGAAGVLLCSAFLRSDLIPRPLAVWGLVGNAALLLGSALQVLGVELLSLHVVIGGVWELFIGVWLIVRGFRTPRCLR